MVCYPYRTVFYFCFHWKLDINGYAIPLVSDTGGRLQWNLTLFKSLFILRGVGTGNTWIHTNRPIILTVPLTLSSQYLYCFFVSPSTIVYWEEKTKFMSILYLSGGRKTSHSKWSSEWFPVRHLCPLGQCGAAVINGNVTLTLSHFIGRWRQW